MVQRLKTENIYGHSPEQDHERVLIFPDHTEDKIVSLYVDFYHQRNAEYYRRIKEDPKLIFELEGDLTPSYKNEYFNAISPDDEIYKSAIVFIGVDHRFEDKYTKEEHLELRNQEIEDFVDYLFQKGVAVAEHLPQQLTNDQIHEWVDMLAEDMG